MTGQAMSTARSTNQTCRSGTWSYPRQLDLLPAEHFTAWLPDETLFSLASRRHVLSGNARAALTCKQLFGHPQRGAAHDFPSRIDEFVRRTRGELGSADSIIRDHTLLPYYLPFRTIDDTRSAMGAMRGDGIGSLKFQLGILTSRFRAHHPLKACLRCMADDRARFGVAYWHVIHQYPGVWTCPEHGLLLFESTIKANGVGRFLWHLPHEIMLVRPSSDMNDDSIDHRLKTRLVHLANAAIALARLPVNFHFDTERLLALYLGALQERGLRFIKGRIRLTEAAMQYHEFVSPYRSLPELSALPGTVSESGSQMGRLLRLPRAGVHPVRHLLMILWLYETWDAFWGVYTNGPYPDADTLDLFRNLVSTTRTPDKSGWQQERFLKLIKDEKFSVSKAARAVGVDTYTGIAWAAKAGIRTPRRSKVLTPRLLSQIVRDLREGREKSWVGLRRQVTTQCVTRILRSEVGLRQAWVDSLQARRRNQARDAWLRAAANGRSLGAKAIRLLTPAVYAWLYRNDRAWLKEHIDSLGSTPRSNHPSVDWDRRDRELAQAVSKTLLVLNQRMPGMRLSLNDLHRHLPDLRAKLGKLEQLPLTKKALELGLGRRRRRRDQTSLCLPC